MTTTVTGKNIEAIYRLSPLQEGILFHTLERPDSGVYFEQYGCTLTGELDRGAMQRAWKLVVARHAVLRTLFTWEQRDRPLQIVRTRVELPFDVLDWSAANATGQDERLASWLRLDRDRGFDLKKAPLTRITLIKTAPRRHRLIWSFHHLLVDGWSMRLILDEALQNYAAVVSDTDTTRPPAPAFADFIAWLDRRDAGREAAFWRDMLAGFDTPVWPDFGATERDPHPAGAANGVCEQRLQSETYARLRATAREQRLTLNTLVVGAWALLLARLTDRDDIVFGTTVAGRPPDLADVEQTAGLFINTLPLRVGVDNDAPLHDYLRTIQGRQASMREFEQTPLVAAQRASDVAPGTPLFETIVVFENFPSRERTVDDSALGVSDERYVEYSHFPLALLAVPDEECTLHAVHDPRRIGKAAVKRLLAQLDTVLEQMSVSLDTRVGDVTVLPSAERQRVLTQWNDTQEDLGPGVPVQQLFEDCAASDPDSVAVFDGDGELRYGALDKRANRLAHFLLSRGVRPDTGVVVYAERGADAIVAILATLKAGAAYVPMDANYPGERLRQVLEDLDQDSAPIVLTQKHLEDRIPADIAQVFCLDMDLADRPEQRPVLPFDPDQLAYVIYTSGSTGRPKGVMISHASLLNSTRARAKFYGAPPSAFLLLSSLATDSSVAGVFWALCAGGTLILPAGRAEQDIESLSRLIESRKVTHSLCVPSLYALILENAPAPALASLRTVIVAGEACPTALVEQHHRTLAHAVLYNEYGPSEACVWASVARLTADDVSTGVTIGRPVANVRLYVLDSAMRPLPIGIAGELHIGGTQVARGYLHCPEQTAGVFVTDPFCTDPTARLYKTGDRARWRADGRLEFVGRIDQQIKIRGFRVEPGEIEAALTAHAKVEEAVVWIDSSHDEAMVAALADLDPDEAMQLLAQIEELSDEDTRSAMHQIQTGA